MIEAIVRRYAGVLLPLALILAACQKTPLPVTDVFTPTPTLAPSSTPFPTATPTLTPTVALPVLAGTPAPLPVEPISPQNAERIQELAIWGKGSPRQVAFSPDGKLLAVGTTIGIWLYDAETLDEIRFIETPTWVSGMAFSADGSRLFAQTGAAIVWTWDTGTGECLNEWRLQGDVPGESLSRRAVTFSPGDTGLIAVSEYEKIWIWDLNQEKRLHTLEGHTSQVESLTFSSDAKFLASASLDKTVRIWDVETGLLLHTLTHTDYVVSLVFSPDDAILVSGLANGQIWTWDTRSGTHLQVLTGHTSSVDCLAFAPATTSHNSEHLVLASGSGDFTVRMWDVETSTLVQTLPKHDFMVTGIAFSSDGSILISLELFDDLLRVWDARTGKLVNSITGYDEVWARAISSTNIVFATSGSEIQLWDVSTGRQERTIKGHTGDVTSLALSANGKTLASCERAYRGVWVWDLASETRTQIETGSDCWGIGLSPDGRLVAVAVDRSVSYVYDVQNGERLHIIGRGSSLFFSPDGKRLITGADGGIDVWDVPTEERLTRISLPDDASGLMSISSNNKMAAVGTREGVVILVDIEEGKIIRSLEGLGGDVKNVAFSPNGAVVAACVRSYVALPDQARTAIKLWDVRTGELLNVPAMEGYIGETYKVFFTPDGKLLVSVGGDNATRLWGIPPSE